MEQRVKFKKGKQREFLGLVVERLNCISVRGILQFGFDMPYSTFKNYYCERRFLPKSLFDELCHVSKIDRMKLKIELIDGNFGQVKGGLKSKRF